jgi:hydrogenase expression/formation protein HypE
MALGDIAEHSEVSIEIDESALPATESQRAACELLGLDPLYIACEGTFIAIVAQEDAEMTVEILRGRAAGQEAAIIGRAREPGDNPLEMVTSIGSRRVVGLPSGEQMPRIC